MDLVGKYTVETLARERGISRQGAINLLSRLKQRNLVRVSGGGCQKRIYTITPLPIKEPNGFYTTVNRYAKEKLTPTYLHYVHGTYTIEHAIIDGLRIGDVRTTNATMSLFNHVTNWTLLFRLAKKHDITEDLRKLYRNAQERMRVRRMPKRYA